MLDYSILNDQILIGEFPLEKESVAVAHQRPMDLGRLDPRLSKARRPQVFVDADLERPGLLPVEAGGVQLGQPQRRGRGGGHGGRFGIDDGGRVGHGLRFRSVRVREMRFRAGLARRGGMGRPATRAAVVQHGSHLVGSA